MARYSMYSDVRIQCPYYKYTVKLQIFCEDDHSVMFRDASEITGWKESRCEQMNPHCPIRKRIEEEAKNGRR